MSILKTKTVSNDRTEKLKKDLINPKSVTPLNLLIDTELHTQFKIRTTIERTSMTDVIVEAIKDYLARSAPTP